MSTYLKDGSPTSWFKTVRVSAPHLLHDFSGLIDHFCAHFGDSDIVKSSQAKLDALKQTGSCAMYASKSREYHVHLQMTEETKITTFYKGLKSGVKDLLVGKTEPPTFNSYVQLCIELDNAYHRRENERRGETKSSHHSSYPRPNAPRPSYAPTPALPTTTTSSDVVPMEIDAIKRGPISQEEKDRRRKEGLCFYCGKGKHAVDNCPNMSEKAKAARAKAKVSSPTGKA